MADVAVTADVTRIDTMEVDTYVSDITGGEPHGADVDFRYQGSASISRKVSNVADAGFGTTGVAAPYDLTGTKKTIVFKVQVTNVNAMDAKGSTGLRLRIGSSPSDYYEYDIEGYDSYPARGGWLIRAIDPNIAGYRSRTVGTPDLTNADWFGIICGFTAAARDRNLMMDSVDLVGSLTLKGGDGASADGSFADFKAFDYDTINNRYGIIYEEDGVYYVTGCLIIGSSAEATEFTTLDEKIIFPNGRFAAGYSEIKFDLSNSGTVINLDRSVFIGQGDEVTTDTRPDFTVSGSNGSLDIDYCFFINFRNITLSAGVTFDGNNIVGGSETLTQNGATIANSIFDKPVKSAGEAFVISDTPNLISGCEFYSGGAGHAIEITDAGTYTFQNNIFVDYGANDTNNASIYNNSGGHVTLNVTGCSGITVRNGSGATTTVNQVVLLTINVEDEDGDPIEGAAVAIYTTGGTQLMNELSTAGGVAQESYSYVSDTDVIIRVRKSSSGGTRYFPLETADVVDSSGLKATVVLIKDNIASA